MGRWRVAVPVLRTRFLRSGIHCEGQTETGPMKALTLTQPWAGLVVSGIKKVENRPRPVIRNADLCAGPVRIAIHASRKIDESVYVDLGDLMLAPNQPWYRLSRITSAIIGVVTVYSVVRVVRPGDHAEAAMYVADQLVGDRSQARWVFGPVCYLLRDEVVLPMPLVCSGRLGLWTIPPGTDQLVCNAVAGAAP